MKEPPVTRNGKLRKKYLPALYIDTSLLIEYWLTEGMERPPNELDILFKKNENPLYPVVRELVESDAQLAGVVEIRRKILSGELKTTPVVGSAAMVELMEWHADSTFRQVIADSSSVVFLREKDRREVGGLLRRVLDRRRREIADSKEHTIRSANSGTEAFIDETWLDSSYAFSHGLRGLVQADLVSFRLPVRKTWGYPSLYAYLQLSLRDILHLLFALHLGCRFFGSFHPEYARVKDLMFEENGITLLSTPREILEVL